jgi:hypothetical protein
VAGQASIFSLFWQKYCNFCHSWAQTPLSAPTEGSRRSLQMAIICGVAHARLGQIANGVSPWKHRLFDIDV